MKTFYLNFSVPKNSSDWSSRLRVEIYFFVWESWKIIKKRWWSAGSAEGGRRNFQFFPCMRYNCLFLFRALTQPLAVIASEFNYFFRGEKKKLSIGRSLWDVRHAKRFFLLLSANEWIAWNFTHTSSLILIDVADRRFLKTTTGRRFLKGKIKGRPNEFLVVV
jgi:hypothetical protein